MLVIKAYVNHHQIDEIHIHNEGKCNGGIYEYKIVKPKGHERHKIYHLRSDGWRILTEKALRYMELNQMEEEKFQEKTIDEEMLEFLYVSDVIKGIKKNGD